MRIVADLVILVAFIVVIVWLCNKSRVQEVTLEWTGPDYRKASLNVGILKDVFSWEQGSQLTITLSGDQKSITAQVQELKEAKDKEGGTFKLLEGSKKLVRPLLDSKTLS